MKVHTQHETIEVVGNIMFDNSLQEVTYISFTDINGIHYSLPSSEINFITDK